MKTKHRDKVLKKAAKSLTSKKLQRKRLKSLLWAKKGQISSRMLTLGSSKRWLDNKLYPSVCKLFQRN